jgi:hypothetical protein
LKEEEMRKAKGQARRETLFAGHSGGAPERPETSREPRPQDLKGKNLDPCSEPAVEAGSSRWSAGTKPEMVL